MIIDYVQYYSVKTNLIILCNATIIVNTVFIIKTQDAPDDVPCLWIAAILSPSEITRYKKKYILVYNWKSNWNHYNIILYDTM